ncbi:MAG: hypothetical protein HN939_00555 [Euryarchaeota archaeon]|nr:hypothetical protein [Euryarchaeota archaeon]MBT7115601.1 hypothetical protein [Euryarchaeota archaeon]
MDYDHCKSIFCICGFRGSAIPVRQHMECPTCRRVVEACCEGVPDYDMAIKII